MALSRSRLIGAILGFSLLVFAAGLLDARAQETAAGAAPAGACPNDGAAAFADPLNKPHWNGWGVDPSQHRFQPADMARLAPSDVGPPETEMGLRLPGRCPVGRPADDFRWARVCREPEWKSLFARRQKRVHVLAVRRRQARSIGRRHRPARRWVDGVFRRRRGERLRARRADRQAAMDRQSRSTPGGDHHGLADAGRDDPVRAGLVL